MNKTYTSVKRRLRNLVLQTNKGYRLTLKKEYGVEGPRGYPNAPWENAVLKTHEEQESAIEQVKKIGLPVSEDLSKTWDSLAALDCILRRTNKAAKIFDAGAELYSVILPWLFLYGYKNLWGINLVFESKIRRGPILYEYGDITKTNFKKNTFDAISCLSVIEHGVELHPYFKEMSRILKPNGVLITSTDYYETEVDTRAQEAYRVPIHVFTKEEIMAALDIAKGFNLELTGPINLKCQEKVIHWKKFRLDYTFIIFTLYKVA